MTFHSSLGFFIAYMALMVAITSGPPVEKHPEVPVAPRHDAAKLAELRSYCQRYGKEPWITRCVEDRAYRNNIAPN